MPKKKLYKVGKIVGHRGTEEGAIEYKIRWEGYSSAYDTWEPEDHLKGCEEFIQQYIMESAKVPRRQSIRIKERGGVSKSPVRNKSPARRKSPGRPRTSRRRKPREKRVEVSYSLRSRDSVADEVTIDYSSEEDLPKPAKETSLSEAKFRRLIGKGKDSIASSTPSYAPPSKTIQKALLDFSDSECQVMEERSTTLLSEVVTTATTVAEADSDEEEETAGARWLDEIGWKEFALASFLTGIGVIGYICYSTDYCNYC